MSVLKNLSKNRTYDITSVRPDLKRQIFTEIYRNRVLESIIELYLTGSEKDNNLFVYYDKADEGWVCSAFNFDGKIAPLPEILFRKTFKHNNKIITVV